MSISIGDLQKLCKAGAIRWTSHAVKRLMQRGIFQINVTQAIENGKIIEQYPDDYPYPSCLLLGTSEAGDAIHVVCGLGEGILWIITAYYPDPDEWETDLQTRRLKQ